MIHGSVFSFCNFVKVLDLVILVLFFQRHRELCMVNSPSIFILFWLWLFFLNFFWLSLFVDKIMYSFLLNCWSRALFWGIMIWWLCYSLMCGIAIRSVSLRYANVPFYFWGRGCSEWKFYCILMLMNWVIFPRYMDLPFCSFFLASGYLLCFDVNIFFQKGKFNWSFM